MAKSTLKDRVRTRVARSKSSVFLRNDFNDLGGYDQIGRALRVLEKDGRLVRLGYGVYAKARTSSRTGKAMPVAPVPAAVREALKKMNVETASTELERQATAGRTTQVPTGMRVGLAPGERCKRRLGFNGRYVSFESTA